MNQGCKSQDRGRLDYPCGVHGDFWLFSPRGSRCDRAARRVEAIAIDHRVRLESEWKAEETEVKEVEVGDAESRCFKKMLVAAQPVLSPPSFMSA